MTITKLILTGSYGFDQAAINLVPLHRRGVDDQFIRKVAGDTGVFHKELQDIKPIDGHTVFHILAVGDQERYGFNRNGDGFSRDDNKKNHHYFKTAGHVYANHKNTDPKLAVGHVLATAHNDPMDRIELLVALNNEKNAEEIQEAENGRDIPFSMGSSVAHDVCSLCGHKAKTAADHCDHIKNNLLDIVKTGQVIGMENPDPQYFDISKVFKPADRIAYSLRKVASLSGVVGGHDLAEAYGVCHSGSVKHARLVRLAEHEKHMAGVGQLAGGPRKLKPETVAELKKKAGLYGRDQLLASLHGSACLLGFEDFCDIVVGQPKLAATTPDLTGGFARLLDLTPDVTSLDGADHEVDLGLSKEAWADLTASTGLAADAVHGRVLRTAILVPITKVARIDSVEQRGLEEFYLHYKLACACHARNDTDALQRSIALTNILRP
jgi:hypothetical protein